MYPNKYSESQYETERKNDDLRCAVGTGGDVTRPPAAARSSSCETAEGEQPGLRAATAVHYAAPPARIARYAGRRFDVLFRIGDQCTLQKRIRERPWSKNKIKNKKESRVTLGTLCERNGPIPRRPGAKHNGNVSR